MFDPTTFTLTASVGLLVATDLPLPVELSALAMVGIVLRWALTRDNHAHDAADRRLSSLEADMDEVRAKESHERHLKHALQNEITAMRATIAVMLPTARRCSCEIMDPLIPVLERLSIEIKRSEPA